MTAATPTSAAANDNELKRNALGLPSAMAMSLAFISPTIGVIFISSLIGGKAGLSSPFAFILGTLGIALMASTLAEFAKRITSAGDFYKFICQSFGTSTAFVVGMLLLLAYVLQSPLNINLFGGFVSKTLAGRLRHPHPLVDPDGRHRGGGRHPGLVLGAHLDAVRHRLRDRRGHRWLAILLLLIIFKGGDRGQVPTSFPPSHSPSGFGGIGEAFVFIVFAFFGFESVSRSPRRPATRGGTCRSHWSARWC